MFFSFQGKHTFVTPEDLLGAFSNATLRDLDRVGAALAAAAEALVDCQSDSSSGTFNGTGGWADFDGEFPPSEPPAPPKLTSSP